MPLRTDENRGQPRSDVVVRAQRSEQAEESAQSEEASDDDGVELDTVSVGAVIKVPAGGAHSEEGARVEVQARHEIYLRGGVSHALCTG